MKMPPKKDKKPTTAILAKKKKKAQIICKTSKKKYRFSVGEKILCYEGRYLYEAKCLDTTLEKGNIKYKVHYSRYKSKYDEWVDETRVLKQTEKNTKLMIDLRNGVVPNEPEKKEKDTKTKVSSSETSSSFVNSVITEPKLLITPPYVCTHDDFLNMKEVKIRIPEDLKPILVDDWELIVNQSKLLHLPAKFNIDQILSNYYFNKTQTPKLPLNHTLEGYENFITNLKKYFNCFLAKELLYPMERKQFSYLKTNYETMTSNFDKNLISKEFLRAWKKQQKTKKHLSDGATTTSVTNESNSNSSDPFPDTNSQSETSDSSENLLAKDQQPTVKMDLDRSEPESIDFTKFYGFGHLLRLFTKLGHYLFFASIGEEELALLNTYIDDFFKFLFKNLWTIWNYSEYIDSTLFNELTEK